MNSRRLIFLSSHDPRDVTKQSGWPYSLFHALTDNPSNMEITWIGGGLRLLDLAARVLNRAFRQFGFSMDCCYSTPYAIVAGCYLTVRLSFARKGVVLAIAASNHMPYVITKREIIYISDATFHAICDLYPAFKSLPKWLKAQGHRNEMKTLARTHFALYPSGWASDSARVDYGVPIDRIYQLPFGPSIPDNLIDQHYSTKSVASAQEIVVIFVSTDWKRKNGDKAINVCRLLIETGIRTRLILVGHVPEYARHLEFVDYRGFLRKSDPAHLAELCRAYQESHFLLSPTTAEAFGIVFSEAQAFGVPPIAHDVGGTGSAIASDNTGLLLPLGAPPEMFAKKILQYIRTPELYGELSRRCREQYLQRANWRQWSALIFQLSRQTVQPARFAASVTSIGAVARSD
jgi:glycosyltransferase involved in cell wall biosynthesis